MKENYLQMELHLTYLFDLTTKTLSTQRKIMKLN
jgi:hypothetical protein